MTDTLLAGDIGGTKTVLGLYTAERGPRAPLRSATFDSRDHASLDEIVRQFLRAEGASVNRAAFGIAGPVTGRRVTVTNLPWVVDADRLSDMIGAPVVLLNDLVSVAAAVPNLAESELHALNDRPAQPGGTIAVVAPGTGLGEGFLTWDGERYRAYPSEGGHAGFGPETPRQRALLAYLLERYDRVSWERVASGSGVPNLYDFLLSTGEYDEPGWLQKALSAAEDPTPVILQAGLSGDPPCPLCDAVLDLFVRLLGSEAGNMALKVFATGGVYLGGGIPPHILPALMDGRFMAAFRAKGRFVDLLSEIPIHVIDNPRAALLGAAGYGLAWKP